MINERAFPIDKARVWLKAIDHTRILTRRGRERERKTGKRRTRSEKSAFANYSPTRIAFAELQEAHKPLG